MHSQRTIHAAHSLMDRVLHILHGHPRVACRGVRIRLDGDVLTIEGQVATFYEKQLVQESVRKAGAEIQIENRLVVVRSTYRSEKLPAH